MLKSALKAVLTFGLLVAAHVGYREGFALLSKLVPDDTRVPILKPARVLSNSALEMQKLAVAAFGPNHWTTDPTQVWSYYDAERGYYLFFKSYDRTHNGKRMVFSPFAAIWRSRGKENLNTVLAKTAHVDFDRPFELGKLGSEGPKVVHAEIEGEVRIRDDKGTRGVLSDDLTIGPMTRVEYDEPTNQISTDSYVELHEKDLLLTAEGATLYLRSRPPAESGAAGRSPSSGSLGGFNGVKRIVLHKKVHIISENVGRIGIVPGGRETTTDLPRPGELLCDGVAQVELPEPRPKTPNTDEKAESQAPPEPVLARFEINVVLRQGQLPVNGVIPPADQLTADTLNLTLVPSPAPARTESSASPTPPAAGTARQPESLTGLTLKSAEATGHAVWLQSPTRGLEARGNQLIFKKQAPAERDVIYFRGDRETRVDRTDLAGDGKVKSVDTLRSVDVTIYQPLKPGETGLVIARGPGTIESRLDRNQPVERQATWGDRLEIQEVTTKNGEPRRRVELTGGATIQSKDQGWLRAGDRIVGFLRPKAAPDTPKGPSTPATNAKSAATGPDGEGWEIDWAEALGGATLATTSGVPLNGPLADAGASAAQTVQVRDRLEVLFDRITPAKAPAPAPALGKAAPPAQPIAARPAEASNKEATKTAVSKLDVQADKAWARVRLAGGLEGKPEVQEVRLFGGVVVTQSPPPGKTRGTTANADTMILINRGQGLAWLQAFGEGKVPARIESDTFLAEGPVIGLDQTIDFTWIKGAGKLRQEARPERPPANQAEREIKKTAMVSDALPSTEKPAPFAMGGKGPVTITWTREMRFYGRPKPRPGTPAQNGEAYAEFDGMVTVVTPESAMRAGFLTAYLDAPVSLKRPQGPGTERPERPQIVYVDAVQGRDADGKPILPVELVHRKADPATGSLAQKGRVLGPRVWYNLVTNQFQVDGAGTVWLYKPRGQGASDGGLRMLGGGNPLVKPTSATRDREGGRTSSPAPGAARLELTRVSFQKGVTGHVGINPQNRGDGTRESPFQATFRGGVQVLHAPVENERTDIDADDPPIGYMLMNSEELKVVRELPVAPTGPDSTAARAPEQFFLDATGEIQGIDPPRAIRGDRVTYDSVKELVYVYGEEGGVTIVNQDGLGQPFSASRGQAIMYNRKTGEVKMIDPRNALIIDPRSGIRSSPVPPETARPATPPPRPIRRIPQNDKERRGFGGGTR